MFKPMDVPAPPKYTYSNPEPTLVPDGTTPPTTDTLVQAMQDPTTLIVLLVLALLVAVCVVSVCVIRKNKAPQPLAEAEKTGEV